MVREHRTEAACKMCLLGGHTIVFGPFRLFIGASYTQLPPEFENRAAKRCHVGFEDAEWDDQNSEFPSPVDFGKGDTGLNVVQRTS